MKQSKFFYALSIGISTSFILVSPVIALLTIGYFIDIWLQTLPLFLIAGGIVGFITSLVLLYRLLTQTETNNKDKVT